MQSPELALESGPKLVELEIERIVTINELKSRDLSSRKSAAAIFLFYVSFLDEENITISLYFLTFLISICLEFTVHKTNKLQTKIVKPVAVKLKYCLPVNWSL